MRKVILTLIILALALSGCCTMTLPNGTVTKNPLNCVTKAVDILCHPTQAQQEQAAAAAAFLDQAAAFVGGPVQIAYLTAKDVFLKVRPNLCVGLDQLAEAIRQFDAARRAILEQAQVVEITETGEIKFVPPVAIPVIPELRKAAAMAGG